MALVRKDRVKETTATTGTGTYTLAGAVAGFEAFSEIGNSNTTYYCCTDGTDFEVGIGTYTLSGTKLARTTILQSSNSDNAVNWSSGSRTIFCTQPAEKAVFLDGSGNISIPGTIDGRDLATDGTKLDGIEANATADQTAAEIRTLVESATDSNVFTDADHTKLNGIEASADVTDTTNVTAAGALMDSEVTNLAQVKAFDSSDYATAAQGTTADAAMPKAGGTFTGDVTFTGANYNIVFDKSDNALEFADNAKAKFGTSGDLQIYHDGSHSVVSEIGTGNLIIGVSDFQLTNQAITENLLKAFSNGAVELYHDNSKKLETASGGISVTGEVAATSLDISGDVDVDGTLEADAITLNGTALAASATTDTTNASNIGSGTLPNARLDQQLQDVAGLAVTNGNFIVGDGSNFVAESGATARASLGLGTAATSATGDFATAAQGTTADAAMPKAGGTFTGDVTFTGDNYNIVFDKSDDALEFADDAKATFGNDADLKIYHDHENSYIDETGTGKLFIRSNQVQIRDDGDAVVAKFDAADAVELYYAASKKFETSNTGATITGELVATSLDISGDVDVDGTLEADAITVNGTALAASATTDTTDASNIGSGTLPNARLDAQLQDVAGLAVTNGGFIVGDGSNFVLETGATARTSLGLGTAAVLDTGISNTNIPKFTSGVADNDFLRVDGTAIEGRSASQVLSDIGGQASLTFGISNTNAVKIDSSSVADDEYARFTANGLESRSTSEVLSDIGAQASLTFGISNTNAVKIDSSSVADDEFARFTANGLESRSASEVRSDIGLGSIATQASNNVSITGGSVSGITDLAIADGGTGASSASAARTNLGLGTAAVAATGISNGNVPVFTSGVADNDFLRVNGTSIEGRSVTELASDIGAATTDDATALAIALG